MIVSVIYFILYFSLFILLILLLLFNRKPYHHKLSEKPPVSILIAARNEENNILACLKAIEALDYPAGLVEVLIGDDASTDATKAVVDAFIKDKPLYKCITITGKMGQAKGKGNVLAHLAKLASSDYFFFTDADIQVPRQWVHVMLSEMQEDVGVVTGITTTKGAGLFARLQNMDWLYALGLMQMVADLKLPVSTMGNNMLLRRQAYEAVGGFEVIPFSVTEDVAIFKAIIEKGWQSRNIYDRRVLALSEPAETILQLLHQRKRWMRGSMHLPLYMVVVLVLHSAYYPVLLPFFTYTSVGVMAGIFAFKVVLQSIFVAVCLQRVRQQQPWWLYLLFELYLVISSVVLIIFFFLPTSIRWKGRKY
ncbi:glycosyltransferase [Pontibacter sp. SGAir0037]|uniref:glycosyltransferase n=1 Tax=Pontibacter sp. SGAir0037 TaxID=2571030 RepID=UPI0010CD412A|nr:glycosyltransferase [Pontibacter sp. SGAir0037]QCR22418.1 family 2 glycosyl transferase [Pontibacter sp. SGAir0037]